VSAGAGDELAPEALDDLQSVWDFIAADNPAAADRVIDELFETFEQLAAWPEIGHLRPDLTPRQVRFWPVRSYLIVYRSNNDRVQIVAILHGFRDVPSTLQTR
jgi:plasmid stabilization system protein ParE